MSKTTTDRTNSYSLNLCYRTLELEVAVLLPRPVAARPWRVPKSSFETGGSAVKTVSLDQVGREELALPARVQEALGELVGSAKEGLLALSVGVGLGVLAELLEEEVVEAVGPKGKHIPERTAVRHGHEAR